MHMSKPTLSASASIKAFCLCSKHCSIAYMRSGKRFSITPLLSSIDHSQFIWAGCKVEI